jgi:hypothetical protein
MLRSFLAWLDDQQAGQASPLILRVVLGFLVFTAMLGLLMGGTAVTVAVVGGALFVLSGFTLLLLTDRRQLRLKYEGHQRLVSHYCDFIYQKMHIAPQIVSWQQITKIDSRGNAKETIVVRAKTLIDDIQFFRLRFGPGWEQPQRYRRKVVMNVRSLSAEGIPGTRLEITKSWLSNGKFELLAHFHSPPRAGSEIMLTMDWDWPAKCLPLVILKNPDLFVFEFGKSVTFAKQTVILPVEYDAYYEPIGFTHGQVGYSLTRSETKNGMIQFVFEAQLLPEDHRAGMRLELRGRDAATA